MAGSSTQRGSGTARRVAAELRDNRAVVEDGDWRLTGQEAYLAGQVLRWAKWSAPRPEWDHDHCEFCWAEFAAAHDDAGHVDYTRGYVTKDGKHWVCEPCFNDFRERFGWVVEKS